ncbi:MAG: ATP-dependent helicase HrpB [Alphaproteobacteria bacterium]
MADLPIEAALPELRRAVARSRNVVLQAPPGAGKTTRVPLALLEQGWGGAIIVLEPRRLAARAAATRMAATLGEAVGETVGYRVRFESRVSRKTRIEIVTIGVFIRRLQGEAELPGVAAVLFDEFHERSLDNDLALAFCLESQSALRPDLRLLAMSATLDGAPIARLLGDAPVVVSEGKIYPVETKYLGRPLGRIEDGMTDAIQRALREESGDVLAFLPGQGEIRRVSERLEAAGLERSIHIAPLFGDMDLKAQDQAIRPSPPGQRKVVLATSIAETSLTIEGVRVVIDSGLARVSRFDPNSGMTRLETVRVSQAASDQRRGRAGRTEPGVCYRLWDEQEQRALAPFNKPEILEADLAPLALELAAWGVADARQLPWLDPPPEAALAQARELLRELEAIDETGRATEHGNAMAGLGVHPRLAHMMLKAKSLRMGALGCDVAALLSERDIVKSDWQNRDIDLRLRLDALRAEIDHRDLRRDRLSVDRGGMQQVRRAAKQWRKQLGVSRDDSHDSDAVGLLVAFAYPDRIAQRRAGAAGGFRLRNGRGAVCLERDALAKADFIAIADLDGDKREARIFRAAPLARDEIEHHFKPQLQASDKIEWDEREGAVKARRQMRLGELVLDDRALPNADEAAIAAAVLQGIRRAGLATLPWTKDLEQWRTRVQFLRRLDGETSEWPDLSDAALLASLPEWLGPYLRGITRRSHFAQIKLADALYGLLDWRQQKRLGEWAPTHMTVPTGSRIPLDYASDPPVLAVRLQELFGQAETPSIAGGKVKLVLHLLSPARRPLQVTRDLASFWANVYQDVKKDMRGQYPKHYWPDNPREAEPTRRAKPRAR